MKKLTLVLLTFMTINMHAQQIWQDKIDTEVLIEAIDKNEFEFFIVLKDQANTCGAKHLKTKADKANFVFNILQTKANETQVELLQLLEQSGQKYRPYFIVNGIWVKGNMSILETLAKRDEVARIAPNPKMHNQLPSMLEKNNQPVGVIKSPSAIEWGISMIRADDLWDLNVKGSGVIIGGQDTGYDWTHPAINGKYKGSVTNHNYTWHDAIHGQISSDTFNICGFDSKIPCDDGSHGTHTMGTMVGDDGLGNQIGVAPEARWIGCRNMENGWGTPATYIECFEWFLAPTDTNNLNPNPLMAPHVIANSWGCPPSEGCNPSNFSVMQTAVENLKNAGTFIAVSAGNSGWNGCSSVNDPAAIFEASFSVGASDIRDTLANFSSRGHVTVDSSGRMKPNVTAPGVDVRSCIPGSGYANYSGTSMAGPHVAGAVALLISAAPDLAGNVDSLETILEMTADTIYTYRNDTCGGTTQYVFPNNMVGYGRINLIKALQFIRQDFTLSTDVLPVSGALQVFPNPFSSKINLKSSEFIGDCHVSVTNTLGQQLFSAQVYFGNNLELDLSQLYAGLYIIVLENKQHRMIAKVVKQ